MDQLNVTETSGVAAAQPASDGAMIVVDTTDGRKLTLTYPGPLAQYKLVLAMGSEAAENGRFVSMCLPLIYLSAIDGAPTLLPTTLLQIEAIIGRLGHTGLQALQKGIRQFDQKEDVDSAKK
ncbi:MAG: hypothetical protein WCA85_25720 [Paraburkholderia sp.]|uniref:hypothetical protein n=1 Tax=Paraburkholderia sp. TaxID=1926495 RepID=UPI003C55977B